MNPEEKTFIYYNLSLEIKRLSNMIDGLNFKIEKTEKEKIEINRLTNRINLLKDKLKKIITE